jgi:hypothetical protein
LQIAAVKQPVDHGADSRSVFRVMPLLKIPQESGKSMKSIQRKIFAIFFAVCLSAIAGNVMAQEYYPSDVPNGHLVRCRMLDTAYEQALTVNDFTTALNIMEIMESKDCFNFSL